MLLIVRRARRRPKRFRTLRQARHLRRKLQSATQLPPRPCQRSRFRILSSAVRGFTGGAIALRTRA
jgi:hypothetical protein